MKKVELLAPSGNMESLKAAVAAGCDAVYLGLNIFSARAFAGNFDHEELKEAVEYCHIRNVKVYVTMNTMLYEKEIENARKEIDFLYESDVDALLIQDLGLFHYVRTCYPDFDVHCSTQMHIHNLAGVKYMQKEGAARVVMARETPLSLIRQACDTGMDIEVFVYGAICISYSGQCLMSAATKNRSANKGMCAQCCRLRYHDENDQKYPAGEYLLSPKDLNVIDQLPQLLETGVSSLKIEGRMKRPEYVYLVTKTFREAIDAYYEGREYRVSKKRQEELLYMFNRGFSKGHLFGADVKERMSQYRPNHRGIEIGKVLKYHNGRVQVKLSAPLYQRDGLRILHEPNDIGLTAVKIEKNQKLVDHADKGDVVWLNCKAEDRPLPNEPLQKTTDVRLMEQIRKEMAEKPKRIPVRIAYHAKVNQPLIIEISDDQYTVYQESDFICEKAKNAPLVKDQIESAISKISDLPYVIETIDGETDGVFIPRSQINENRRAAFEQLNSLRKKTHVRKGRQEYQFDLKDPSVKPARLIVSDQDHSYQHEDTKIFTEGINLQKTVDPSLNDPVALQDSILSEVGDLWMAHSGCIGGMTLNTANSYAAAYLISRGCEAVILSSEVSNQQAEDIIRAFESRYGFVPVLYKPVYGKRTLMYIKDTFLADKNVREIYDIHRNGFKLKYNEGTTEILESRPYRSANSFCYGSYLIFTDETGEEKGEILEEAYEEIHGRI